MACSEEYSQLIALYPHPEDQTPEERAKLEAHIQECAQCRADLEEWQNFLNLIRSTKDLEVPRWVKESLPANVMKAIRRKTRIRETLRIAKIVGAVAAVIVVGWGAGNTLFKGDGLKHSPELARQHEPADITEPESEPAPTAPAEQISPLRKQYAEFTDIESAFAFLKAEYEKAVESPDGGDFETLIPLFGDLAEKPRTYEGLEAKRYLSWCYRESGEILKAHKAFVEYSDAAGEFVKIERLASPDPQLAAQADAIGWRTSAMKIIGEANRLHTTDPSSALSFCDTIIARYPNTRHAREAMQLSGRILFETGHPQAAAEVYATLIQEAPDSIEAIRSVPFFSALLYNEGRPKEAAELWLNVSKVADTDERLAWSLYHAGSCLLSSDPDDIPEGVTLLSSVIRRFPQSNYARLAQKTLAKASGVYELEREMLMP